MMRCTWTATVWVGILAATAAFGDAMVPYGVGSWPEAGRGNHRAVVHVAGAADAVRAHIAWRRRDHSPETKAVLVFDAATGKEVANVARIEITRAYGDIAFQPATAPGDYEVYYLPYNPGTGNFDDAGTYFAPKDTADAAWIERNHLRPEELPQGAWKNLPEAAATAIQARTEFDRMDPMEIVATADETAALLARCGDAPYLVFPEDRSRAIRMFDDLPISWVESGPRTEFSGAAQPGEFYPFQLGLWAARAAIRGVSLDAGDLTNAQGGVIPARNIRCINLQGVDWLGQPIAPSFEVGQGQVRALWIGVDIPPDAAGTYEGIVTLRPLDAPPAEIRARIDVAGDVAAEGGVNDLWRLSRLKWLDSTLGLDEEVVAPFTALAVAGNAVSCIGRDVHFNAQGLPERIVAGGRDVLSGPIEFQVDTADGVARFAAGETRVPHVSPGVVERETESASSNLDLTVRSKMEFDGCIQFSARLKAREKAEIRDVRLEAPMPRSVAAYMMGFSKRGGFRDQDWHWKWNYDRADNQVWLGDAEGGVQLTLCGEKDVWNVVTLHDAGLPASWCNDGKGGCDVVQDGARVFVRAYSGGRTLEAGQDVEFRFRLLVTPFKPIDQRHWNWRYGDVTHDANILHIHHAMPENPFINYPFLTTDLLKERIDAARAVEKRSNFGQLTYPAEGALNLAQGALHIRTRVNFDPAAGTGGHAEFNQALFSLDFPNEDSLGFYWNVDVRGMRAYTRSGAPSKNHYPSMADAPAPEWKQGDTHLLTLSWGDDLAIFVDGQLRGRCPYRGLAQNALQDARLTFCGQGFVIDGIRIDDKAYTGAEQPSMVAEADTLLLDAFARSAADSYATIPAKGPAGVLTGVIEWLPSPQGQGLRFGVSTRPGAENGVNLYYTVRELSNHVAEMWPLRSLGSEVFSADEAYVYSVEKAMMSKPGGGYPWLMEHLQSGYVPSWRQPLWNGETDAAIGTQGLSRWHNYYVEGLQWLMRHTGLDGLYLDGIGYDRAIMKRIAKVMSRNNPGYRINFHGGNDYAFMDRRVSPANSYMEHFPYLSNLWMGEMYDYDLPPDYWLVEISGIPFGLTSEMLDYENGGNPYRGMIYGMTGRLHASAPAMWRFWDAFAIQDSEMLGYWTPRCPVKTNRNDVLATVYRKAGKSLIALAHWPCLEPANAPSGENVSVALTIDWPALGLAHDRAKLAAPRIEHFQGAAHFDVDAPITFPRGQGALLCLESQEPST